MTNLILFKPDPFSDRRKIIPFGEKATLLEIVSKAPEMFPDFPDDFAENGVIKVGGVTVPKEWWGRVSPNTSDGRSTSIVLSHRPAGKKLFNQVLNVVASVAVAAISGYITGGGLSDIFGENFKKGTLGASVASLLIGGALGFGSKALINALAPPPSRSGGATQDNGAGQQIGNASAEQNLLQPNSALPRVVGTAKVFPKLVTQPLVEVSGYDNIVEVIYGLDGPHKWTDIRIDGVPIGESEAIISYQIHEGWPDLLPQGLIPRYAFTESPPGELIKHKMSRTNGALLENQSAPESSLPQWSQVTSTKDPDEVWISILAPQGISEPSSGYASRNIPFRLRMRPLGTTAWLNLPELHFNAGKATAYEKTINLIWGAGPATITDTENDGGAYYKYAFVPDQTAAGIAQGWTAHTSFVVVGPVIGDARRTVRRVDGFDVYLDPAVFPRGNSWEIQIKQGALYNPVAFHGPSYLYSDGLIHSFFDYFLSAGNSQQLLDLGSCVYSSLISRSSYVYNKQPVGESGFATLSIRAKNANISRVSSVASGYVPDWDGSSWSNWVTTSNPAPHIRHAWTNYQNDYPVDEAIIDNDEMVAFRTRCEQRGYRCDAAFDGQSILDVSSMIAGCGYARVRASDTYGVVMDRYTGAEDPVEIFSPRDSNISFSRSFADIPDGLLVKYRDRNNDYRETETIVYRPGVSILDAKRFEAYDTAGLTDLAAVKARMEFTLSELEYRSTVYTVETWLNGLICRRGDLVAINDYIIKNKFASALLVSVVTDPRNPQFVTGLVLDTSVNQTDAIGFFGEPQMFGDPDIFSSGVAMGASIRLTNRELLTRKLAPFAGSSNIISFETGFYLPQGLESGCQVVLGEYGETFARFKVLDMRTSGDISGEFRANLTLVPEAPQLHAAEMIASRGMAYSDGTYHSDGTGYVE